ncbi:MAG: hypothetical protein V4439_02215 [Patescibacteria group bacterium]
MNPEKFKDLVQKARILYPDNRVEESGDTNPAPYVFLTEEDKKAGPTAVAKKYKMTKGVAYRALSSYGFFRPWYLNTKEEKKRTPAHHRRNQVFMPSQWAMENPEIIIKAARQAAQRELRSRFGSFRFTHDEFQDIVSETIVRMYANSSKWDRSKYSSDFAMALFGGFRHVRSAINFVLFRKAEQQIPFSTFLGAEGGEEKWSALEDEASLDAQSLLETKEILKNVEQAIVATYGPKTWTKIWRWANSNRVNMPEEYRKILETCLN